MALELRKGHPDWKNSWVDGFVISALMKQKDAAIMAHKDFAFETNFSTQLPLTMLSEFKKANYKLGFIYFGLSSVDESVARVTQRYATGGHNIPYELIKTNFILGIHQTQECLHLFDNVLFIDGLTDFGDIVALHIGASGKHVVTDHYCPWFDKYFRNSFEALSDK